MTDQQWHDLIETNWQEKALSLLAQGYQQIKRSDIYKYHFEKDAEKLVIVRQLGSPRWYTREL